MAWLGFTIGGTRQCWNANGGSLACWGSSHDWGKPRRSNLQVGRLEKRSADRRIIYGVSVMAIGRRSEDSIHRFIAFSKYREVDVRDDGQGQHVNKGDEIGMFHLAGRRFA